MDELSRLLQERFDFQDVIMGAIAASKKGTYVTDTLVFIYCIERLRRDASGIPEHFREIILNCDISSGPVLLESDTIKNAFWRLNHVSGLGWTYSDYEGRNMGCCYYYEDDLAEEVLSAYGSEEQDWLWSVALATHSHPVKVVKRRVLEQ